MFNLRELREKRSKKVQEAKSLFAKAKEEKRSLSPEEKTQHDNLIGEIDVLSEDITRAERQEQLDAEEAGRSQPLNNHNGTEARDLTKYSFLTAVRSAAGAIPLEGLYKEMHDEAITEARSSNIAVSPKGVMIPGVVLEHRNQTATGGASGDQGGVAIATGLGSFIDVLRSTLILAGLGADFMTGLVGNLDFPEEDAVFKPTWLTENAPAQKSTASYKKKSMKPKRLAGFMDVSDQLLIQTSPSIEARVRAQMIRGVQESIDLAGLNGSGSGEEPTGILNTTGIGSVVGGANGALPTYEHLVRLVGSIDAANALLGSLGWATNTQVRTQLQLTKKDTGSGIFVWGDNANTLNGYKAGVTNLLPANLTKGTATACSPIVFGNFNDLYIGMWAGIEVLPDPYTQAANGMIRMHVKTFADVLVARAKSFAAMKDALTA